MSSGTPRLVLRACGDLPTDPAGFVPDREIAEYTGVRLPEVRDALELLEGGGLISVARPEGRYKAHLEAGGRLALSQDKPFPAEPSGGTREPSPIAVARKGLRPCDAEGAVRVRWAFLALITLLIGSALSALVSASKGVAPGSPSPPPSQIIQRMVESR